MTTQLDGLWITGCQCSYGSFFLNRTSYAVDPNGPQGSPYESQSPVTIETGNGYADVEVTFALNGVPVGASAVATGQQYGIGYSSDPMNLAPGTNTVTITAVDPLHLRTPFVMTVAIPYEKPLLVNKAPPLVQGTPAVGNVLGCTSGLWTYNPAPTSLRVEWDESPDGNSWTPIVADNVTVPFVSDQSVVASITVGQADAGQEFRCVVSTWNPVTNVIVGADSAPTAKVPGQPPAPPITTTTTEPATTTSGGSNPPPPASTAPAQPAPSTQPTITKNSNGSVTGATVNLRPTTVHYTRSLAGALSLAVGFKITVSPKTVYILHGHRTTGVAIAKAIKKIMKVTIIGSRHGSGPFVATKITVG